MSNITCLVIVNGVLFFEDGTSTENMLEYFQGQARSRDNFFKEKYFRNIIIFLAGYRPDFFISPVQCALRVRENIFKHRVNRENFYCKNPNESVQNIAMTVKDFLSTMPSFINKSIKFGLYQDIYLTEQQMKAVGHVNEDGEFCPKRQLIFGPAGSGKSLILMLQVFILAQIRSNVALFFITQSELHLSKLSEFVEENKTPMWRNVRMEGWDGYFVGTKQPKPYDLIRDEEHGLYETFHAEMFSSENKENVITCVVTGSWGRQTNAEPFFIGQHYAPIDEQSLRESFQIIELGTVFRSSKQIQVLLRSVHSEMNTAIVSGHNFDGVKVEIHNFENEGLMMDAVKQRIDRLIDTEQCKPIEIGLYYPSWDFRFPQIPESNTLRSDRPCKVNGIPCDDRGRLPR